MKLLRLKITDPNGFRSLQSGFEHQFRTPWELQERRDFEPFICAGPNGSGKSNLLEVLAAIFFNTESRYLDYLPRRQNETVEEIDLLRPAESSPDSFELEYLIPQMVQSSPPTYVEAHVLITKSPGNSPELKWLNQDDFGIDAKEPVSRQQAKDLLPKYILGYSSGENEILSLPFFKMRFVQFDEYLNALKLQLPYSGRPETRLIYLDNSFSQAILLSCLLFHNPETLKPFREDVGIEELKQFRIIIRRSIEVTKEVAEEFRRSEMSQWDDGESGASPVHPAVTIDESGRHTINLIKLLESEGNSDKMGDPIIARLSRCASCSYFDEDTETLYLDYCVSEATRKAFWNNFDQSAVALFQALQVLLTLNLYSTSDALKTDLYKSDSLYVGETVPMLASDKRIMRFKNFWFKKKDLDELILLKSLSDGEHQFLHTLGLCLLFGGTDSLFLLDEPETHFNPDWRAKFVSRLAECFEITQKRSSSPEILVTTHAPFLISDSRPEQVLVFRKAQGTVAVEHPDYNTLGASINKITMNTFGKRETIGNYAEAILQDIRKRAEAGENKEELIAEINRVLGDSVEKVLLIKSILAGDQR